jgi:hypothetical protein
METNKIHPRQKEASLLSTRVSRKQLKFGIEPMLTKMLNHSCLKRSNSETALGQPGFKKWPHVEIHGKPVLNYLCIYVYEE